MTYTAKFLADALGRRWVFNPGAPPMAVNLSGFPSDPNKTRSPNSMKIEWYEWRLRRRNKLMDDSFVSTKHMPSPALIEWLAWSMSATFNHWSSMKFAVVMGSRVQVLDVPRGLVPMVPLSTRDAVGATRSCARFMEGGHVALQTVNDYFVASVVADAFSSYRMPNPSGALAMRQEVLVALSSGAPDSLDAIRCNITRERLSGAHARLMRGESVIIEPWEGWLGEAEEQSAYALLGYKSMSALVTAFVEAARMVTGESPEEALLNAEINRTESSATTLKF